MVEGVDYAFSRPDIGQLAALGKVFACRYGGPGSSTKHLTLAEAQALSTAGISIVANAEGAADGLLGGWNAGVSWASSAEQHFRNCGMPADRPIYLSVDFDVKSGQWPAVREALRGAASVLSASRVGVYGGRWAIEWARRDRVAVWFWQTYAWSFGVWAPGNHLEQYRNGVTLAGGTLDLDRALKSDYGQWTIGGSDMDQHDKYIAQNTNQFAHYEANELDPIRFIKNVDTNSPQYGADTEMPNLALQRQKRIEAKVDALAGAVKALADAVAAGGGGGLTADTVRRIVDEELDEQSLGGADNDAPQG